MVIDMKAIFIMGYLMVMVSSRGPMGLFMRDSLPIIVLLARVYINGLMAVSMKEMLKMD